MRITPPSDDYGLQGLREENRRQEVKTTHKVDATPPIESSEERHEPAAGTPERRVRQRRRRERRRVKGRAMVDTRATQERRQEERRQEEGPPSLHRGVDDFA